MGYRQAVRHKTLTLARDSSNLSTPANGGYSSVGRAPDCGSGCRRFESCYPPHLTRFILVFFMDHRTRPQGFALRASTQWLSCEITLKQQAIAVS